MKTIYIVTGANGFLGNNIIRKLESIPNSEIRALVLNGDSPVALKGLDCKIYYGDVRNKSSLNEIFKVEKNSKVIVIHVAAVVYIKKKYNSNVYDVNVNGTKNIVQKVLEVNGKLVYVNSVHAIKEKKYFKTIIETKRFNPNNVIGAYAKTKAEAAKYVLSEVKKHNLNACIVHPSGIIGSNDYSNTHLTELIKRISNKSLRMIVGGGYNLVDVRDVSDAIIEASKINNRGQCYILSNKYITIFELANLICEIKKIKPIHIIMPMILAKIYAVFAETYYNLSKVTPLFTKYSLYTLKSNSNFSNEKARRELKFNPRDIKTSLIDTIKFLEKFE